MKKDKIIDIILKSLYVIGIIVLFWSFDICLRYLTFAIDDFFYYFKWNPNLATVIFIGYFFPLFFIRNKKASRITLSVFYVIGVIYFMVNYFMLKVKSIPMDFYNLHNASEGLSFVKMALPEIHKGFVGLILGTFILFCILLFIRGKINFEYKFNLKRFIVYCVVFITLGFCNFFAIHLLDNADNDWDSYLKPGYYYDNFINSKRSAMIMGFYEYSVRDFYIYIKNNYIDSYTKEEVEEVLFSRNIENEENEYTGIFKGKNLIMVMMESIDNLVVDKESMPTLYKLQSKGWNFTNRYSAVTYGGSTILSEYTTISGLLYNNLYYRLNNNTYNQSIPSVFINNGYVTTYTHENIGTFYNRNILTERLGFQNAYFLYDMGIGLDRFVDAQWIYNDMLYEKFVPKNQDQPFMTFFTTISAHGPYVDSDFCNTDEEAKQGEFQCFSYLANRTDEFFRLLLERLEEDDLLDDTVIIMYTDHYAYNYSYTDDDIKRFTPIDDEMNIRNIPFVIYSTDIKHKDFDMMVNDFDMAPTIFNLFGMDYDAKKYLGVDLFSKYHKNLLVFNDGSWYDGTTYSYNSGVDKKNSDYVNKTKDAMDVLNLNDMLIKSDYYR